MKGLLRMNWCKHRISLYSSHPINTKISINLSTRLSIHTHNKITTSRTNTHHKNHTNREGVVENLEEEVEEEDLVEEEAKLHAITMENWVIMLEIA